MGVFVWDYLFLDKARLGRVERDRACLPIEQNFLNEIDEAVTELCARVESVPVSESPQLYGVLCHSRFIYFSTC